MKLILASQSQRRKELLTRMGLEFDTVPSNFEEYFDQDRPADEIAKELGLGKVRSVAESHPNDIVIGGDLMVVLDGKQLGKPESESEAVTMLRNFSNRTHKIITSVAVVCRHKEYEKVLTATAYVTFDELSDELIREFVKVGNPYDKGGGYAIQHPLLKPHVTFKGRQDTILGMPTTLVAQLLADFGYNLQPVDLDSSDSV